MAIGLQSQAEILRETKDHKQYDPWQSVDALSSIMERNLKLDFATQATIRHGQVSATKPYEERTMLEKVSSRFLTSMGMMLLPGGQSDIGRVFPNAKFSEKMSPEDARKFFGIDVDEPIYADEAYLRANHQRIRRRTNQAIAAYKKGGGSNLGVLGMELGTSFLDPINLLSFAVPAFGYGKAAQIAKGGASITARGVVATEEALVKAILPKAMQRSKTIKDMTIGIAEGSLSSAVLDIPRIVALHQEQGDLHLETFMKDLMFTGVVGGVFGGTLRTGLGLTGRAVGGAAKKIIASSVVHNALTGENVGARITSSLIEDAKLNQNSGLRIMRAQVNKATRMLKDLAHRKELKFLQHWAEAKVLGQEQLNHAMGYARRSQTKAAIPKDTKGLMLEAANNLGVSIKNADKLSVKQISNEILKQLAMRRVAKAGWTILSNQVDFADLNLAAFQKQGAKYFDGDNPLRVVPERKGADGRFETEEIDSMAARTDDGTPDDETTAESLESSQKEVDDNINEYDDLANSAERETKARHDLDKKSNENAQGTVKGSLAQAAEARAGDDVGASVEGRQRAEATPTELGKMADDAVTFLTKTLTDSAELAAAYIYRFHNRIWTRLENADLDAVFKGKTRNEIRNNIKDLLREEMLADLIKHLPSDELADEILDDLADMIMTMKAKSLEDPNLSFNQLIKNEIQDRMTQDQLAAIRQIHTQDSRVSDAKQGFNFLIAKLTGAYRKGVEYVGENVHESIKKAAAHHAAVFESALRKHGLADMYAANNADSQRLAQQIITFSKGGTLKQGDELIPGADKVGETLRLLSDATYERLRASGSRVQYLKEYGGYSTKWDSASVGKVPKEEWVGLMKSKYLDIERTKEALPFIKSEKEFDAYLGQVYDDIKNGHLRDEKVLDAALRGGNLNKQAAKRRHLFIKEGFEAEVDAKFGSGDTAIELLDQIMRRAEMAKTVEWFGPNYKQTQKAMLEAMPPEPKTGFKGAMRMLKKFSPEERFKAVMDKVVGEADHPVNESLARFFQGVRQVMDLVSLEMAGMTALVTDPVQMTSMLQHIGLKHSEAFGLINAAIKDQWTNSPNKAALRTRYLAMGAGLDAWANSVATRMGGSAGQGRGMLQRSHRLLFRVNGLRGITSSFQNAYMDAVEQAFARMVKRGFDEVDMDQLATSLERYGITRADLKKLEGEIVKDPRGVERIMLGNVADDELARKFRNYMADGMRQAVLEPSAVSTSLAHLGFQAGTWGGEIMRTVTQYLPFAMAVYQKTFARLTHGYGEKGLLQNPFNGGLSTGQQHMIHMMMLGTFAAAAGTMMKDTFRGREPALFDPVAFATPNNMARIFMQTGMLPVMDGWLADGGFSVPMGPAPQKILQASQINSGAKATTFVLDNLPFIDVMPFMHEAKKAVAATVLDDIYGAAWQKRLLWFEEHRGGGSFIHPL